MYNNLCIIVPCYNEEKVIPEFYKRIKKVLEKLSISSEIIFINDGSSDHTETILNTIAEEDNSVKIISFSRNFGHQNAVTAGLNNCNTDLAVIIDVDLQDPPELIPDMIKTLKENEANMVYCIRKKRKGESYFKKKSAKLFYRFLNMFSEIKLPVDSGDFRIIDRNIITEFNRLHEKKKYIRGLVSWVGYKHVPFYYEREPRLAGETKYPLSKMVKFATSSMLYFSTKPLRIATMLGFLSVIFALGLTAWSIMGKIFGYTHADTGWTSLFVLITFFGGIQLITIGIIGAYVGNLFEEIKNRPEYIIKDKKNFD
jgi:dolichol-phosphate mannosyltransferase